MLHTCYTVDKTSMESENLSPHKDSFSTPLTRRDQLKDVRYERSWGVEGFGNKGEAEKNKRKGFAKAVLGDYRPSAISLMMYRVHDMITSVAACEYRRHISVCCVSSMFEAWRLRVEG